MWTVLNFSIFFYHACVVEVTYLDIAVFFDDNAFCPYVAVNNSFLMQIVYGENDLKGNKLDCRLAKRLLILLY